MSTLKFSSLFLFNTSYGVTSLVDLN